MKKIFETLKDDISLVELSKVIIKKIKEDIYSSGQLSPSTDVNVFTVNDEFPDLKGLSIYFVNKREKDDKLSGMLGQFNEKQFKIYIYTQQYLVRSTVLHELRHALDYVKFVRNFIYKKEVKLELYNDCVNAIPRIEEIVKTSQNIDSEFIEVKIPGLDVNLKIMLKNRTDTAVFTPKFAGVRINYFSSRQKEARARLQINLDKILKEGMFTPKELYLSLTNELRRYYYEHAAEYSLITKYTNPSVKTGTYFDQYLTVPAEVNARLTQVFLELERDVTNEFKYVEFSDEWMKKKILHYFDIYYINQCLSVKKYNRLLSRAFDYLRNCISQKEENEKNI